jgi:hypothetical protein
MGSDLGSRSLLMFDDNPSFNDFFQDYQDDSQNPSECLLL